MIPQRRSRCPSATRRTPRAANSRTCREGVRVKGFQDQGILRGFENLQDRSGVRVRESVSRVSGVRVSFSRFKNLPFRGSRFRGSRFRTVLRVSVSGTYTLHLTPYCSRCKNLPFRRLR